MDRYHKRGEREERGGHVPLWVLFFSLINTYSLVLQFVFHFFTPPHYPSLKFPVLYILSPPVAILHFNFLLYYIASSAQSGTAFFTSLRSLAPEVSIYYTLILSLSITCASSLFQPSCSLTPRLPCKLVCLLE